MKLNDIISNVVYKQLAASEIPGLISNQHELSGVSHLKYYFGSSERIEGTMIWHYFADDQEPEQSTGKFSFYDCRENDPNRSPEWRFYYGGDFLKAFAKPRDWLFLARDHCDNHHALVFENNSSILGAAKNLFKVSAPPDLIEELQQEFEFEPIHEDELSKRSLEFLHRQILEQLQLDQLLKVNQTDEEIIAARFGFEFPETKEMSGFARTQTDVDTNNIDETLVRWLDREYELFRALEKRSIEKKLELGFEDVDDFLSYSLSATQRRRARMGLALENHLEELFKIQGLLYSRGMRTEGRSKPDFIFPGEPHYHNKEIAEASLDMLGVKSTCKDRWRQILNEAARIPKKHLCTLQLGISEHQTDEMDRGGVILVVPAPLQETYTSKQLSGMMDVAGFIDLIRHKQSQG